MEILIVPARNDLPSYNFRIDLDDTVFQLSFRYNQRMDRWVMDILNQQGANILMGILMLTEVELIPFLKRANYPQGDFVIVEETGKLKNAGRLEFGDTVELFYQEAS